MPISRSCCLISSARAKFFRFAGSLTLFNQSLHVCIQQLFLFLYDQTADIAEGCDLFFQSLPECLGVLCITAGVGKFTSSKIAAIASAVLKASSIA